MAAALPGVAIAAALVPPLCVVGFGLGASELALAGGALLLFVTNLGAIVVSAALVFLMMGFRPRKEDKGKAVWRSLAIAALVLLVVSIPLGIKTREIVGSSQAKRHVMDGLDLAETDLYRIAEVSFDRKDGVLWVRVAVHSFVDDLPLDTFAELQRQISRTMEEDIRFDLAISRAQRSDPQGGWRESARRGERALIEMGSGLISLFSSGRGSSSSILVVLAALSLVWIGCAEEPSTDRPRELGVAREADPDPRRPKAAVVESLRADLAAVRHPADGGGSARLEILATADPGTALEETAEPGVSLQAGGLGRFLVTWTAGPLGVAEGGGIYLQISPFWGWSTPQVTHPEAPGFTEVSTSAKGVALRAETLDRQLLVVHVEGRALKEGETVQWLYGAGPAMAQVDRFAEQGERFWLAVDGDGDGVRGLLADPPTVSIGPGPAARVVALLPSTATPHAPARLHLSLVDRWGNAGIAASGRLLIEDPDGQSVEHRLSSRDSGTVFVPWQSQKSGVLQLQVSFWDDTRPSAEPLRTQSNPMWVAESAAPIYWGDLQVHSNRSDGTGLPVDLYRYGRDVARLDVMSVTDHDHWGLRFLDHHPAEWQSIQEVTESLHQPGRFVTIRGFEWTNWIHGHRHVLVFDDQPLPVLSSLSESYDHPEELWAALHGRQAVTIAHHTAGGPIATDWSIAPDPVLEPITEVVSVHGSSEAEDSPKLIYQPVAGNFVREAALGRGYRLGLIGSTDGHDGHPGLGHLAGPSGGLAAILADDLTRSGVLDALRKRRVYATSGPRIVLRTLLAGRYRMGAEVPVGAGRVHGTDDQSLWVYVAGHSELDRIDVVQAGRLESVACERRTCSFSVQLDSLEAKDFLYVRAVQRDGHFAVSSPFFFVESPGEGPTS